MNVGIIGLPNVGKTTLFNALTRSKAPSENYPFCTIEPNRGAATVPEPRLSRLASLLNPGKVIPARVEFLDVAGLVEGASKGHGLGNQFLSHVRGADILAQVVRCFGDAGVASTLPEISPLKELEIVATELLLADLQAVENILGRKSVEDERRPLLSRLHEALSHGRAVRELGLSAEEHEQARDFGFLSMKPLLVVANVSEGSADACSPVVGELRGGAEKMGADCISVCGLAEQEMSDLPDEEADEFARDMGLPQRALPLLVRRCYELLGLVTFFTVEGGIVQAWPIPAGTTAPVAAGRIHTDMERGFIRAEVVPFGELSRLGGMEEARAAGVLRVEGRTYVVRDGDIIRFRFSPPR